MTSGLTTVVYKKDKGEKIPWIRQDIVIQFTELTEDYLRICRVRFNNGRPSWKYIKLGNSFYYSYNDIPDKAPTHYRSQIPSPEDLNKHTLETPTITSLREQIKTALETGYRNWYSRYTGNTQLISLARAAASLEVILKYLHETPAKLSLAFCKDAAQVLEELQVPYLPRNERRLKEKIELAIEHNNIHEVVQPPRLGNKNALRVGDPEIEAWIIQMRGMGQNYTNSFITRKLRDLCELVNKPVPSVSWFNNYLANYKIKWMCAPGRFGARSKHGNLYKGYVPVANALFAGDCWQMDGSRVNFIPHTTPNGEEVSLYIIVVRDVYSGDVLGYHFDTKENRWGYINALKMAVQRGGYVPFSLTSDRFPGHNTEEWKTVEARLQGLGVQLIRTHKATGKPNVERWFSTLQTVFMQSSYYYYGEGVQSRNIYAHRSAEYLTAARKEAKKAGFDFDAAWKEATQIVEAYNNTELSYYSRKYKNVNKSPKQLHSESARPHTYDVDVLTQVLLFGLEKEATIKANGLITTEILRIPYTYVLEDVEVISRYRKVILNYDLEDLKTVYLYLEGPDGQHTFLCEAKEQKSVQMYGPNPDFKALAKAESRIKKVDDYREQEIERLTQGSEVELLMQGMNNKNDYGDAETAWLDERAQAWKDHGQPRIINSKLVEEDDEDDDINGSEIHINVRRMY